MKLINKIRKAESTRKNTLWQNADLSSADARDLVRAMILSLPKGTYTVHGRGCALNLVDVVSDAYGWMPSMFVDEPMLLGLQALYPSKIYASFTLGLDVVEIK